MDNKEHKNEYKKSSGVDWGNTSFPFIDSNCPHRLPCGICKETNQQCPLYWNVTCDCNTNINIKE